jgi:hypothetical protein
MRIYIFFQPVYKEVQSTLLAVDNVHFNNVQP